jgi:formiminoglutamate deiminase
MTTYWLERAWLGIGGLQENVLVSVEGSRFCDVTAGVVAPPATAKRLTGLTIPGFANCHSHAFHRALRGRTQAGRGSFWTWREQMYALARRLDPDRYLRLARAVYAEMASVGITTVGEFHYLHHGADGTPYSDPNVMGEVLIEAARSVGLRIALLDACYLAAGIGRPPEDTHLRFSDGTADSWAARVDALWSQHADDADVVVGAAVHSVRAVPREQIGRVAAWSGSRAAPLHVHLSEQVAENDACMAAYGVTPTQVLEDEGALGPRTSVVHATHLSDEDVALLGSSGTAACFCPTTERDLGDGIGPSRRLHDAGCTLTLGTDSHAVVDMCEEMRAIELDERLATRQRGHWSAAELAAAATASGHASMGFPEAGVIAPGAWADLVTLDDASPRTAGAGGGLEMAVFAATAADVVHVVASGREVTSAGVGRQLTRALSEVMA